MVNQQFEQLAERYVQEFPALSPVSATQLGDHRVDGELEEISPAARQHELAFCRKFLKELEGIDREKLSRANQVDYALINHRLRKQIWEQETLQEWAWNPLVYTEISGGSIYGLMARNFAPPRERLLRATARLKKLPRFLEQVRGTLVPARVPRVHAETAIKQNRGLLSILDNMVRPKLGELSDVEREELNQAMALATSAIDQHQTWLTETLLPAAKGEFRLGAKLYDEKLRFTLGTPLTREDIRRLAEGEIKRVRAEMYELAKKVYGEQHPYTQFPEQPSPEYQQAIIRAALERAATDIPAADGVVEAAEHSMKIATDFVREKNLMSLPESPLDIIIMPEFQRGVSIAYCDSPGPLDSGEKTFYAVAPLPSDWTAEQATAFLREYNRRSSHNLTVHEALPGHYVQLAHSNNYPGKRRAVCGSGIFIEGWACYTEQMLSEEGFLKDDPLMRLTTLKWYLRAVSNSLLDQAIHVDGLRRADAMRLMIEDTFQEEREAALKWTRAQLTSAQLSTYFVGYQEHRELRRAAESKWKDEFNLKRYHEAAMSFGSPPVQYVRALLLDEAIPGGLPGHE
jgi:uncharacterized protein (DUF885 family)